MTSRFAVALSLILALIAPATPPTPEALEAMTRAPTATATADALAPTADTLIQLWLERHGHRQLLWLCPQGPLLRLLIPYEGTRDDVEWVADFLPWRPAAPLYAVAHYPPAPARYADGIWVDSTGDGRFDRVYLGPDVGTAIDTLIPTPCPPKTPPDLFRANLSRRRTTRADPPTTPAPQPSLRCCQIWGLSQSGGRRGCRGKKMGTQSRVRRCPHREPANLADPPGP